MFDLIKQIEDLREPYGVIISQLSGVELLKERLHGYLAALLSCANLKVILENMQQSSCEKQLSVTLLKQFFNFDLSSNL